MAGACGGNSDEKPSANNMGNSTSTTTASSGGATFGTTTANQGTTLTSTGGPRSTTGAPNTNGTTSAVGGSGGSAGMGGGPPTGTAAGGTGNSAGGSAGEGGCSSPEDCAATEYCDFRDDMCGTGESGSCVQRPMLGTDGLPTCGCDGVIYTGPTIAIIQGTDLDALARCGEPFFEDAFWCGPYTCPNSLYCEITETPCETRYDCNSLPSQCEDCSCIDSSGGECSEGDMGALIVRRTAPQCL